MKNHGIGLLALTLTSVAALATANAADLNRKAEYYKAPPVLIPMWAGLYLGAHIGGAWGDLNVTDFNEDLGKFKNSASGVFGGGTIGYNFQTGSWVYGVEADLGGMDLRHATVEAGPDQITSRIGSGFYLDATARLGYAIDHALVYAKGGYAFYDGTVSVTDPTDNPVGFAQVNQFNGWTVGGGIEYKLDPAWSVKAEYQYFDFGTKGVVVSGDDPYDNKLTIHTVKAGVNYHFKP